MAGAVIAADTVICVEDNKTVYDDMHGTHGPHVLPLETFQREKRPRQSRHRKPCDTGSAAVLTGPSLDHAHYRSSPGLCMTLWAMTTAQCRGQRSG